LTVVKCFQCKHKDVDCLEEPCKSCKMYNNFRPMHDGPFVVVSSHSASIIELEKTLDRYERQRDLTQKCINRIKKQIAKLKENP